MRNPMLERDRSLQQVAVIGLGRFGLAAAKTLFDRGHEVLGIDHVEEVVQRAKEVVTHAVQAELYDIAVVHELGLHEVDAAIVAIGDHAEASIFSTSLLVEAGVPHVVARAHTPLHGLILERVGAHRVVYPEAESGEAVAQSLRASDVAAFIELGPDIGITKLGAPAAWVGRSLAALRLPEEGEVIVLAIQRGEETLVAPGGDERIGQGDILAVLCRESKLDELPQRERGRRGGKVRAE
ncbi:MAG: TrkA family potassium uptake protein [Chloroflexota bacterium]|nr:TrkA family potassium uptake protein [Chloroflexota bacterium]